MAAALTREPDPRLAARSDPWAFDRQLHDLIVEHERVLVDRHTDLSEPLEEKTEELRTAEARLGRWRPSPPAPPHSSRPPPIERSEPAGTRGAAGSTSQA